MECQVSIDKHAREGLQTLVEKSDITFGSDCALLDAQTAPWPSALRLRASQGLFVNFERKSRFVKACRRLLSSC